MNAKPVLFLSLLVNVALLGAIGYLAKRSPAPVETAQTTTVTNAAPAKTLLKKTTAVVTNVVTKVVDWRSVESEDYKQYIANLRSIGCPEETIKDIILADVNKLFEDRKKALKKPAEKFKFWETGMKSMQKMMGNTFDEETVKQNQALAAEKRALIRELLGIEIDEKPDLAAAFNPFESMLDFLPASKQTRVMELMQQFQAKQMKNIGNGQPDEMDLKAMQKSQREMEAEIAAMLTPQEYDDYQLRLSQTSMMMRMTLDGFNPSEDEFRSLFKVQKEFDDQFSPLGMGSMDKDEQKKRADAQKELDAKIKATLGDQRYAEYQREKDYDFKAIAKVAERQGLPKESAVKVFDMKKVAQDQANAVRNDKSLNQEQKNAALQAVQAETERSIGEVLGSKGLDSYKKGNNAWWLNNMAPKKKEN